MHKSRGATLSPTELLAYDWHKSLNVAQLAAYVRYQYIRLRDNCWDWDDEAHSRTRKTWDGGQDSYGVKHQAVWPKIAHEIRNQNAHPGAWVCAHFSEWAERRLATSANRGADHRPQNLCKANSFDIYRDFCANIPQYISNEFTTAGTTMRRRSKLLGDNRFTPADKALYLVCDETYVVASPFFRHAFAARFNAQPAVERYFWRAATDYEAKQHLYDQVVEPWCVTAQLRNALIEIRQHWLGLYS